MPEFHRLGHGRYARWISGCLDSPWLCGSNRSHVLLRKNEQPKKTKKKIQAIMTASSSTGNFTHPPSPPSRHSLTCFAHDPQSVVPNFLVQTGDRTGTGAGGESFFGGATFLVASHPLLFFLTLTRVDWVCDGQIEQFEDEIHPRLRFAHRGLVGMANNSAKNSNDSQFFITLGACISLLLRIPLTKLGVDRADELHGKHTLFGRCVGDTIYSGSFVAWNSVPCR